MLSTKVVARDGPFPRSESHTRNCFGLYAAFTTAVDGTEIDLILCRELLCFELPVVVYQQSECGRRHGNFISASYRAILRRPEWRKRLQEVHSQGRRSLPARNGSWRELDSSLSSDAPLTNIFCYPGMTRRKEVRRILGLEPGTRMRRSTFPLEFFRKMKSRTLPKTIYEIACRTGVVLMEPVAPPFSTAAPAHHGISLVRR